LAGIETMCLIGTDGWGLLGPTMKIIDRGSPNLHSPETSSSDLASAVERLCALHAYSRADARSRKVGRRFTFAGHDLYLYSRRLRRMSIL
jgi:hypothetical protein